jgi:hypothetical protein
MNVLELIESCFVVAERDPSHRRAGDSVGARRGRAGEDVADAKDVFAIIKGHPISRIGRAKIVRVVR